MDDWKTPCVVDIACPIVVWLRDTYILDPEGRVAKDEVYAQYQLVAERKGWPLKRNSDFGKVVKKAFPDVASRRLGSAGKQVAHYSGISLAGSRSTTSPTVQCAAQRSCASTPPRSQTQQTRSSPHLHRKTITPRTPSSDASSQEDSDYSPYEAYESPTRGRKRPAPRKRRSAKDEDEEAEDGSDDEYNADEDDGTYTFIRRQSRGRNNRKENPQPRSLDFARPRKRVKQENFSDEVQQPSVNLSPRPSMIPHGHLLSVNPMSNPHSSTDAFFSSSATPTSNIPMYHNNNTNSLPPSDSHHGVVDEYAEGNDQSPLLQSRTMRRPSGEDMMLPLLPPYAGAETLLTNIQFPGRESVVGMEKGFPENLDDEYDGYSFALDYQPLCYSFAPSESVEREVFSPLKPGASLEIDRKFVQSALDTFHSVMWPYVPLPASVFSEQSVNWFINEGRQRNTRLTLFIETALYYASASIGDIPQAQEIFKCLMMMVPYFYQQNDLNVALVLATLSTCTFSWYEKEEALKFSREFLDAAINMCVNLRQQNSEVYHMCLDIRSWIETGRLTPSLHARFPLHANEYPPFLMPCRVAIKQCLHLVTMVRHIVFILEHAPKGTVLPPSARADVDEKLMMLKTCFNAMSAPVMDGHPFIANYLKLQLVGSMAELRWALGDRNKAITKAIQFVDLCRDIFPFVDVVFYASRVFGILLEANTVEHAKGLMGAFNDVKFTSLKDVSSFLRSCTKRLRNHEKASLIAAAAPSAPDTQTYFQC